LWTVRNDGEQNGTRGNSPPVVPANAGTHNHRPSLLQRTTVTNSIARFRGMGPGFRRDDELSELTQW
jgi:hypothetical protein